MIQIFYRPYLHSCLYESLYESCLTHMTHTCVSVNLCPNKYKREKWLIFYISVWTGWLVVSSRVRCSSSNLISLFLYSDHDLNRTLNRQRSLSQVIVIGRSSLCKTAFFTFLMFLGWNQLQYFFSNEHLLFIIPVDPDLWLNVGLIVGFAICLRDVSGRLFFQLYQQTDPKLMVNSCVYTLTDSIYPTLTIKLSWSTEINHCSHRS